MPVREEDYRDTLRSEQKVRHALATIVNALEALGEHANLVRVGQEALADDCASCGGSGSAGELGCTDCLGTGVDPSSVAGATERALARPWPFTGCAGPLTDCDMEGTGVTVNGGQQ